MKNIDITRESLPEYLRLNFLQKKNYKIAEIGSQEGLYASLINESFPDSTLFLVDLWETKDNDFYFSKRPGLAENSYLVAKSRFSNIPNVSLVKSRSEDASKKFDDEYFDFIYIDADHSFDGCMNDLVHWFPKVKNGGIIAGHDWDCDPAMSEFNSFGVERAVRSFFGDRINDIILTCEQYHKSWILLK